MTPAGGSPVWRLLQALVLIGLASLGFFLVSFVGLGELRSVGLAVGGYVLGRVIEAVLRYPV